MLWYYEVMRIEISTIQLDYASPGLTFEVSVEDHSYRVVVPEDYWLELTNEKIPPEELVKKSFEFLLEREKPGAILPAFDLPLIGHYFPEYEEAMRTLAS